MSDNVEFGHTAGGLHDEVMCLFEGETPGTVLDAPSGTGEMAHFLQAKGFHAIAGDIDESVVKAKDVEFKKLDLNTQLPFEDNSLDYVINVEGLEHLENPHHTIREFNRILKPGGKLILTTPNVLNIFSRLRYLLIGYHAHFGDYYANEDNFYVLHINPVGLPEIDFALRQNDLEIETLSMNRDVRNTRSWFGRIILNLLVMVTRFMTKRKVRNDRIKEFLLSKAALFGEILIVKCVKKETDNA